MYYRDATRVATTTATHTPAAHAHSSRRQQRRRHNGRAETPPQQGRTHAEPDSLSFRHRGGTAAATAAGYSARRTVADPARCRLLRGRFARRGSSPARWRRLYSYRAAAYMRRCTDRFDMSNSRDEMQSLSAEYMQTVQQYEQRITELREQLRTTGNAMQAYRLRRRIAALQAVVNDLRATAHRCAHYYDRPRSSNEVMTYSRRTQTTQSRRRQRFRRSGYGSPTPAAAMRSGDFDKPAISSFCAVLLRESNATRDSRDI